MRSGTGAAILVATAMVLLFAWPQPGVGSTGVAHRDAATAGDVAISAPSGVDGTPAVAPSGGVTPASAPVALPNLPSGGDTGGPASAPGTRAPAPVTPKSTVLVLGSVFFPSNATQLGPDARRMLDGIATTYKGTTQALEIVGHADLRGSAQANLKLSAQRAEAVRGYLIDKGVPAANMSVRYDGARTPMAQGVDPEANAQNRRVEIRVP